MSHVTNSGVFILRPQTQQTQRGLTLVELLVALALGSIIVMAAVAALTMSRQGFNTVDASAQLRDNGRFATSIIRRLVTQAGYLDYKYASTTAGSVFKMGDSSATEIEPNIKGFNDALYQQALAIGTSNTPGTGGVNDSDMLVLRFQSGTYTKADGTETADLSMIDCGGNRITEPPLTSSERILSVFHIAEGSDNEPSLMCTRVNQTTGVWSTQPLVQGIESLQILYGVDGVNPGGALSAADSLPERYLRADQLVASTDADTNKNWERVRSLRIGMVIRGPVGSAQGTDSPELFPLGAKDMMDSTADAGSKFPAKTDRRLRQTVTFTVHLRNNQDAF